MLKMGMYCILIELELFSLLYNMNFVQMKCNLIKYHVHYNMDISCWCKLTRRRWKAGNTNSKLLRPMWLVSIPYVFYNLYGLYYRLINLKAGTPSTIGIWIVICSLCCLSSWRAPLFGCTHCWLLPMALRKPTRPIYGGEL